MKRNLYRDMINNPEDCTKIEKDLSRFENEAAPLIKRFLAEDVEEVTLSLEEDEKLKLFFAIMSFRGDSAIKAFGESASKENKDFYLLYQKDGNLNDFWKRNLGELVNCRSLAEVSRNPKIDDPIKLFIMRDTFGIGGLYFIPVERRGNEEFLISDCYPAVFQGISGNGELKVPLYYVFPISPTRALFLVAKGIKSAPLSVAWFKKEFFKEPSYTQDRKHFSYRFRKIYEDDVKMINDTMFENAITGVAFRNLHKVHNIRKEQ